MRWRLTAEEAAAFMACAYAKYTGKLGVCLATSGPGSIHLLGGLYDAKLVGQPVSAITGLQYHDLMEQHAWNDQVGTDGFSRQSGIRIGSASHGLCGDHACGATELTIDDP
jgi:thiamine pyrophosphate-dependent acetolactate synthase large subunit-like protein